MPLVLASVTLVSGADAPRGAELPAPQPTRRELALVSVPDVQTEIGITAAQSASLSDLWKQHQDLLAQRRQVGGTKEEYLAQMKALELEYEAKARELLGEKQRVRLVQVAMQLEGHRLLARAEVQKSLGVTEAQAARIAELQKVHQDEASKEFINTRNLPGINAKVRNDAIARLVALDARTEKGLLEVLTSDQRKKLETLLGPPAPFRQAHLDRRHEMSN